MQTPKKAVVFGASGLLGTALVPALESAGISVRTFSHREVDIRRYVEVREAVGAGQAHIVLNTAAHSKVDKAEEDPDTAFQVNAIGAHNIALAAAEANIAMLHVSTDYVFDGETPRPLRECDRTGTPPSQYGQSKLLGEQLVRNAWHSHFIVRVAAMFGPGRRDFVDWVLAEATEAKPLTIVSDRTVSPSYTRDVARQIVELIRSPYYGTYHATGHGEASWYELARAALEIKGLDPEGVVPVADVDLPRHAPRPKYSALDNHLLRLSDMDCMRPWRDALSEHLSDNR